MKLSRLALAIALTPGLALAQTSSREDALKLSDTLITANRDVQQRSATTVANTVFTRSDIERLQPTSVLDLLQRAPGVQVTQSGGRGSLSSLFIRGTKTAQNVVLVDGQRIADVSTGGHFLEWLSIDQIERVEILRGPRSTLYGADAIGGVIQIFTRRADANQRSGQLRLGYGSNQTWERSANLALANEDTRFSLNASSSDTQGIDRTTHSSAGADGDHDAYRNQGLSVNFSHRLNQNLSLGFSLLEQRGEVEFDNDFDGASPYQDFQVSSQTIYVDANLSDWWNSRVELGHSENRYKTAYDDNNSSRHNYTYRDSVAWLNTLTLNDRNSVLVGTDWLEDQLHSNNTYSQTSRWNRGLFVQHQFHGDRFSTELGARHDKNQQFGGHSTFSGALSWHLNQNNDVILSYAEGFRAPNFQDIYAPPGWGANPNLQPEESKSYELQWRSQLAQDTRLEISFYRSKINNAIVSDSTFTMQNLDRARVNGFEALFQRRLGEWQGSLGLSLIDPRDADTGHTLNRRARRTLSLDVDRQIGTVSVGAGWQAVSSSYDDVDNTRELSGYGLLALRSSWQASDELQLALKVDNLLDKNYSRAQYSIGWPSTYHNYREEGRSALFTVTWTPSL
ncbi:TonB-dependent receptor domain-containing protein [Stutzerimonas nitrititolerans]|uniref:TonB-dependent receptor domain-containing protein n=1 Tax=Stutzerimonas nitrititolerans TaxID=2482751 RepID=UPI0028972329|nr:TonB-dependent receptor [Stutzerimonas nitrititolerans]